MKAEDLKGMNGRRVLVEGVIADAGSPGLMPLVSFSHGKQGLAYTSVSAIREILPPEIKVGDRVTCEGYTGRVLHIDDAFAWMQTRLGENLVVRCDACTIIEPAQ
jgi:hypothetical protein